MADIPISYPIIVMAFVAATAVIGVLAVKFVRKVVKDISLPVKVCRYSLLELCWSLKR